MADVQKQFDLFDEYIRLGRFDENATLREKREIIRNKLRERLPGVFKKHNEVCPTFRFRDQGSYEMGTGTKPLDGDFDIDQGLYFEIGTDAYPDPVILKKRVHEALDGHTKEVRIRRSCVTVFYQRDGEPIYHVDLAVYSDGSWNPDARSRIAKGKENSATEHRIWDVSDPQGLTDKIFGRFEGNNRAQFRRVVRYLKRWKDVNFSSGGNSAPLGIGLTVAAYDVLQPTYADIGAGKPNDLEALRKLVQALVNRFTPAWDKEEGEWVRRLVVMLPVEPWSDLFGRMSNRHMEALEDKLQKLLEALDAADAEIDPHEACKKLKAVFGDDFPVPPKEETAKRHAPAIVSSSSSA
jgi:hypothetical protein